MTEREQSLWKESLQERTESLAQKLMRRCKAEEQVDQQLQVIRRSVSQRVTFEYRGCETAATVVYYFAFRYMELQGYMVVVVSSSAIVALGTISPCAACQNVNVWCL